MNSNGFLFLRMGRDKETSGRKSWGSADISTGIGVSPPVRSGGPEEQRSLASDDSLGPVSNVLLIPRVPPAQYEVSSSLGYTSTRGNFFRGGSSGGSKPDAGDVMFSFSILFLMSFLILLIRVIRKDDGLSEGLKCPRQVHSWKC